MKERTVQFYKRLIIFTTLSIIIIIAGLLTFLIGGKLHPWDASGKDKDADPLPNNGVVSIVSDSAIGDGTKADSKSEKKEPKRSEPTEPAIAVNTELEQDSTAADTGKTVYITFDDGASSNTEKLLEVLDKHGVKATFFFNTGLEQTSDDIIKKTFDSGHGVGMLTSTAYNYDTIYSSQEAYLTDFQKSYDRILHVTGQKPEILRFPGGSINGYTKGNYKELTAAVKERGIVYFDWNVCAQDSSRSTSKETMVANATKLPHSKEKCILLMHDNGNENTCEALEEIIEFYEANGYTFQKLTANVEPIIF